MTFPEVYFDDEQLKDGGTIFQKCVKTKLINLALFDNFLYDQSTIC